MTRPIIPILPALALAVTLHVAPAAITAQPLDLGGTFSGELSSNSASRMLRTSITFTLVQRGSEVSGSWTATGGSSGTLSGVVTGAGVRDLRLRQFGPCVGEFTGTMLIGAGGRRLSGSYVGRDCGGSVSASFVVDRR